MLEIVKASNMRSLLQSNEQLLAWHSVQNINTIRSFTKEQDRNKNKTVATYSFDLYLPLSHSSEIDISDIFVWVMSLCEAKNSTTSRFSFLIGTISNRHQNGVPKLSRIIRVINVSDETATHKSNCWCIDGNRLNGCRLFFSSCHLIHCWKFYDDDDHFVIISEYRNRCVARLIEHFVSYWRINTDSLSCSLWLNVIDLNVLVADERLIMIADRVSFAAFCCSFSIENFRIVSGAFTHAVGLYAWWMPCIHISRSLEWFIQANRLYSLEM